MILGILVCAGVVVGLATAPAIADPVAAHPSVTDAPVAAVPYRPVRHKPPRVRIYGSSPGPNSVRQCEAHYVQEFRPAGTVIVPRMHCWWEG
ncbi:MAG: hypothetical protein P4M07_25065 [Xanthobacteraceae bacterium]|nr:hypothetical protein [Xanthobacteraceae bacterium]